MKKQTNERDPIETMQIMVGIGRTIIDAIIDANNAELLSSKDAKDFTKKILDVMMKEF